MNKAISKLEKAIQGFNLFCLDCTSKGISIEQAITDSYWNEQYKQTSFNSNDNTSIEFYMQATKQLNFD